MLRKHRHVRHAHGAVAVPEQELLELILLEFVLLGLKLERSEQELELGPAAGLQVQAELERLAERLGLTEPQGPERLAERPEPASWQG